MEFRKFDPCASYKPWKRWCVAASISTVAFIAAQCLISLFYTTVSWHMYIPGLGSMLAAQYISIMRPQWSLVVRVLVGLSIGLTTGFAVRFLLKTL